jgi:transcriptional regulator with XRE-family HTH domain
MSNIDQWNEWMKERGISQTALAEMLHCSRGTVNRILQGKRKPSQMVVRRMAKLMAPGTRIEFLL